MWNIEATKLYRAWHFSLSIGHRARIVAHFRLLHEKGPALSRPYADTVKGSRFSQMKELRVQSRGAPFRIFFAFSPARSAVLL